MKHPELVSALASNPVLTALHVSSNGITKDGAAALAEVLRQNEVLEILNLYGNNIKDGGARALLT